MYMRRLPEANPREDISLVHWTHPGRSAPRGKRTRRSRRPREGAWLVALVLALLLPGCATTHQVGVKQADGSVVFPYSVPQCRQAAESVLRRFEYELVKTEQEGALDNVERVVGMTRSRSVSASTHFTVHADGRVTGVGRVTYD